jgi:hypothetical protein
VPDSEGGSSKGIGDARVKIVPKKKELNPNIIIQMFMIFSVSPSASGFWWSHSGHIIFFLTY